MAGLASHESAPDPVARHGFVSKAPTGLGEPFTVTVPDFDQNHVYQVRRWEARGTTLPAVGDECLVLVDDREEPWVPAWWPAAGDDPAGGGGGSSVDAFFLGG